MQMRIQQSSHQPVYVFLKGVINESDGQILLQESQHLLNHSGLRSVCVYLEQIHHLSEAVLEIFKRLCALFKQSQIHFTLVAQQYDLFQRLQLAGLEVHHHRPDPSLQNISVH